MNTKQYRLNELISPADGHSLVVDTSNGLVLGTLPGLEQFADSLRPLLPLLDGIVTRPGQACNLTQPMAGGPAGAQGMELEPMRYECYRLMGWDSQGIPTSGGWTKWA